MVATWCGIGDNAARFDLAGCRDERLGRCIINPRGQFLCGKAAEHHRMHRPKPRSGQYGKDRLGHLWHVDDDAVALFHTLIAQHGGKGRHLGKGSRIGEPAHGVCDLAVIDHGKPFAMARDHVPADAVVTGVARGPFEPPAIDAAVCCKGVGRRCNQSMSSATLAQNPSRSAYHAA